MKAPKSMQLYRGRISAGEEIVIRDVPWMREDFLADYLNYFDEIFGPNIDVLEFGSGSSTPYIAKRVRSLVSYEHNKIWYEVVLERLKIDGIKNTVLNFDPHYLDTFHCTKSQFDIVINDIWHSWVYLKKFVLIGMECVRPGGLLIFHSHILDEKLQREGWIIVKKWGDQWKVVWKKPK